MDKRITLTDRDLDLLYALSVKTGKFTLPQIQRTWFSGLAHGITAMNNRVRKLKNAGYVETFRPTIYPEIRLPKPVFKSSLGGEPPNAERVSWELRKRWNRPPIGTTIVLPTKKAVALSGGNAHQAPRSMALLHDIHVSALYLLFRRQDAERAESWVHETSLYEQGFGRNGSPLPDAVIGKDQVIAIDFGGSYSAEKVRRLHVAYAGHGLSYELW